METVLAVALAVVVGGAILISLVRAYPVVGLVLGLLVVVMGIMVAAERFGVDPKLAVFWALMGVLALVFVARLFLGPPPDDLK